MKCRKNLGHVSTVMGLLVGIGLVVAYAVGPVWAEGKGKGKGHEHHHGEGHEHHGHEEGKHGEGHGEKGKKCCGKSAAAEFDDEGKLLLPKKYRYWVYLGGTVTPNELNDGKAAFPEFHNTYMDRKSFKQYKKTGKFADGTVLVKELVSVGSKVGSSGNGYFMGEFNGVAASVKSKEHFPNNPGNWGFFNFGPSDNLSPAAEVLPAASCNTCHQASADQDSVFTQYYPVLRAAKPSE